MASLVTDIVLLGVVPGLIAYGAASDLITMTIPNRLCMIIAAAFPAVALGFGMPGYEVVLHVCAGMFVLVISFGLFSAGWIGGGDAKFASAAALWLGFTGLMPFLLYSSVLGGVLTLAIVWMKSNPIPALALRMPWYARLQEPETGIPYGIALSLAVLLVIPDTDIWRLANGS